MENDSAIPIVGKEAEPRCGFCKEILEPGTAMAEFDTGHIAQIFYCTKCDACISIQMIGMKPKPRSSILTAPPRGFRGLKQ